MVESRCIPQFQRRRHRKNFVGHLYKALVQKGIYTYKDDESLQRGDLIGPTLLKAIRESRIAIIIFSENYADSSWCLDELKYIMQCMDERGQIVMPIFYNVEPSHVRKQQGKYGEAFLEHELKNNNKVGSWRKALESAGSLAGWEPNHIANGHESKCIEEIVETISHKLHPIISSVNEDLVGIEARIQEFKSKLDIGSKEVRMVGIWGVGGGGKTTLAYSVYDAISSEFDGCCFIENIREESCKHGLQRLQERILYDVLKQKEEVKRVEEGRQKIKSRLYHKNVLIVLDDVSQLDHLKALAGSHDWFGEGSRIVITTRDCHLLNCHKVDVVHNIGLLNNKEAIKLFSKHAHQGNKPIQDYKLFSEKVVSYAGGLPLALKVIGCFLCDKDMNEWISAIARLKEIPDTDIVEKLKISFDGLKTVEKELFLDIACFYRKDFMNQAMEKLDACGFHPVIGVKVLIQRALITVSDGAFDMHDLVQEMGHYIVRGEHPRNPEKHSRIWISKHVRNICAMDASTELDKIQAIRYFPKPRANRNAPLQVNANMKKLRLIECKYLPGSSLPANFLSGELCYIGLWNSGQRQLWEGYKYLPNLRYINLFSMKNLIMTPDFDGLPNLEKFMLIECGHLEDIHPSIGRSKRLAFLQIEYCCSLKFSPPSSMSKKLTTLRISHCPKLFDVSEFEQIHHDMIGREVAVYEQYSTNLFATCIASCCGNFGGDIEPKKQPDKVAVDVECCLDEPSLPHNNISRIGLQLSHKGLRKLYIGYCGLGDDIGGELPNLQVLDLRGNKSSRINFTFLQLPRLKWLNVSGCKNLVELLELPSSISVLTADDCPSLECIGNMLNCKWLWKVSLMREYAGPIVGDILDSMGQGKAVEDHFFSLALPAYDAKFEFVDRFVRTCERFTMVLPHESWYDEFCGVLICIVTRMYDPLFTIILKPEIGNYFQSEVWEPEPDRFSQTYVGYVSFNLLKRHTPWWNSAWYNMISISVTGVEKSKFRFDNKTRFGGALVPRKSKGDVQTRKVAPDYSQVMG
ncbi:toll/interleukin-1 receptor (TIR) domain-containing protein [Artemisia annua]|uniref:Toll/interleukin-1 receptor (TIR) domain-containing protein n=1 Tax=Artemisia annua TaxID=35608 RepID=A0A2U1N5H0_ARTAN|nr:toll/interleukin-1 receptor (TIR) domain-containing protein [Artemisia annua]